MTQLFEYSPNKQKLDVHFIVGADSETVSINTKRELSYAEYVVQERICDRIIEDGGTVLDPTTTVFAHDIMVGNDTIIHSHNVFGPGVVLKDDVTIMPFCHIEDSTIRSGAIIGPYARIRPGTFINENVKIGNFVEIKNSTIEENTRICHVAYIGDSFIGKKTNIGAGVVTCNYDGMGMKSRTVIGDHVSIGSNSSLIAPIKIDHDSIIGAGSVINKNVEPFSLALSRTAQITMKNKARQLKFRKKNKVEVDE